MTDAKKMGRPTEEVKDHTIRIRVSERLYKKAQDYSDKNSKSIAQTVREALEKFLQ